MKIITREIVGIIVLIIFTLIAKYLFFEIKDDNNRMIITFLLGGTSFGFYTFITIGVKKMILNPNKEHVKKIQESLIQTKNQCPCVPSFRYSEDTLCPCKQQREESICHCNLYVKGE